MKMLLLFSCLLMLSGCAAVSDGNRKAMCALDEGCVQSPLCENLDGLTIKQIEEKFDASGEEKPVEVVTSKKQKAGKYMGENQPYRIFTYFKQYPNTNYVLFADLFFKKTDSDEYIVDKVKRCELRRPTADGRAYMNNIKKDQINKMKNEEVY